MLLGHRVGLNTCAKWQWGCSTLYDLYPGYLATTCSDSKLSPRHDIKIQADLLADVSLLLGIFSVSDLVPTNGSSNRALSPLLRSSNNFCNWFISIKGLSWCSRRSSRCWVGWFMFKFRRVVLFGTSPSACLVIRQFDSYLGFWFFIFPVLIGVSIDSRGWSSSSVCCLLKSGFQL